MIVFLNFQTFRNNGSLYMHAYMVKAGKSPDPATGKTRYSRKWTLYKMKMLNKYIFRLICHFILKIYSYSEITSFYYFELLGLRKLLMSKKTDGFVLLKSLDLKTVFIKLGR